MRSAKRMHQRSSLSFRTLLLPLLLLLGGACSGGNDVSEQSVADHSGGVSFESVSPSASPAPPPMAAGDAGLDLAARKTASAVPAQDPDVAPAPAGAPPMIIRTGEARVEVKELEPAIAETEALATSIGGYVSESTLDMGVRQARSARLVLRFPSTSWERATGSLDEIGTVLRMSTSTEDVGMEIVDLTARKSTLESLETRLLRLIETRTGDLEELLAVERELARVRGEIEQLEGRLRYLSERVRMSTLTILLVEPESILANPAPEEQPLRDALRSAWANFVGFVTGLIAALGFLIPFAVVMLAFGWAALWLYRKVKRTHHK